MGIETLTVTQLGATWIKANLPRATLDPQHAGMRMCARVHLRMCMCVCARDSEEYGSVLVLVMLQANPGRQ